MFTKKEIMCQIIIILNNKELLPMYVDSLKFCRQKKNNLRFCFDINTYIFYKSLIKRLVYLKI